MSLYPYTTSKMRAMIRRRFFRIESKKSDLNSINIVEVIRHRDDIGETESTDFCRLCQHILWMLDEVKNTRDRTKAARWIGWVLAHMEVMGFITNEESRNMVRIDKEAGNE
ncbi:MAG: hypothetical protein WD989_01255 [Candidatus Paceibacterota bacterium]